MPTRLLLILTWLAGCAFLGYPAVMALEPLDVQPPKPSEPSPSPSSDPVVPVPQPSSNHPPRDREVTLFLKDGRSFTGILVDITADQYILRIAGIRTPLAIESVDRFTVHPPVRERYFELRKTLDGTDVEGLLQLIDWLISKSELDLAVSETADLRARFPASAAVQRMQAQLQRLVELRDKARAPEPMPDGTSSPSPVPAKGVDHPAGPAVPLLSADQINLIKVFEIDLAKAPQLVIPRDVVAALMEKYSGHPLVPGTREGRDAILRQSPAETLNLMFRLRAREFYPQVRVMDQPESMRRFRDDVHRPILMNYCATTACHGGTEAGRLVFATSKPNSDPTLYTDFYILDRYRTMQGDALIDWEKPDLSTFLQMALPRDIATVRHPVVLRSGGGGDAWKPLFRSAADRRFQQAVGWLQVMYRPRPDYQVDYTPFRSLTPPPPEPSSAGR